MTEGLQDALDFAQTIGYTAGREESSYEAGGAHNPLAEVDFYTRCPPSTRICIFPAV